MNAQNHRWPIFIILFCTVSSISFSLYAADRPAGKEVKALLGKVSVDWNDSGWTKESRRKGSSYMWDQNNPGWKTRMRVLQKLVRLGKRAIPPLLEALKTGNDDQRIFAAQALGYLAPDVPVEPLLAAAQNDKHAAVRLYAVDSLGMQGRSAAEVNWEELRKTESNRDVKMHLSYAVGRKGHPVSNEIVTVLKGWDEKSIHSAKLGKQAPDFELSALGGEKVRLSSFRGKQAVVLVFIYGDT